jgi:glutaminyl-tRNA synthetase
MSDDPIDPPAIPTDFIRELVAQHEHEGRYPQVHTRFPPEPNGYLHIGHAKSICLNFGIAREFHGVCNLRMDDTNPTKEDTEYVESIERDVHWLIDGWADEVLGLKPSGEPFYASDYFERLFEYALRLIRKGKAFVCDLTGEQMAEYRGTPDRPGRHSPYRERTVAENLDLFIRMRRGEFADGGKTLRAKIDMDSPNIHMRDPVLYRIRHAEHHRTGDAWCIYPMYDYAHCLSDAIEGISHSICTLEFEVHRPLYDWLVDEVGLWNPRPNQYEFARLNLTYTVMSKRKLLQLVEERLVKGWDDPRLPTISGLRRRGVTPEALREFANHIGVTKYMSLTDVAVLEHAIRGDLNKRALRRLAVLNPIKVVITNFPEGQTELCEATNLPDDPAAGTRQIPFTRELWIEADDFFEVPPPKFFRLRPGGEVRLKYAYIIKCESVVKDEAGKILEIHCTADLESKTGGPTAGRKVKGTIHWVSAQHALSAEIRLYDRLFTEAEPEKDGRDFKTVLNPGSLEVIHAKLEPSLADATADARYQFERLAYFCLDLDSKPGAPVFNRTITLKDAWAKAAGKV